MADPDLEQALQQQLEQMQRLQVPWPGNRGYLVTVVVAKDVEALLRVLLTQQQTQQQENKRLWKEAKALTLEKAIKEAGERGHLDPQFDLARKWTAELQEWKIRSEEAEAARSRYVQEWDRECADADKILIGLGLPVEDYRTEGGSLNVGKILERLRQQEQAQQRPCPCQLTTPCHPSCTCVQPSSSRGCSRCCAYGSREQQIKMAEHLAATVPPQEQAPEESQRELREAVLGLDVAARDDRAYGEWDAAKWHVFNAAVKFIREPSSLPPQEQAPATPEFQEETVLSINVFCEEDGQFAAEYRRDGDREGGMGSYSATPIGALAELIATLIKVDEDKAKERLSVSPPAPEPPK